MNPRFDRAGDEDTGVIGSMLVQAHLPTETFHEHVTTFYKAVESGRIVGAAGFEFYGDDALLRSVVVLPETRNMGVGSRLVDYMLKIARDGKIRRVILLTETAEKFFSKKGFKVINRNSVSNVALASSSEFAQACPQSAVCMALELGELRDGNNSSYQEIQGAKS